MESQGSVGRGSTEDVETDAWPFKTKKEDTPDAHVPTKLDKFDLYYSMKNKPRGRIIIFNHESYDEVDGVRQKTRKGTSQDVMNLESTFHGLGFKFDLQQNKTYAQIISYCRTVARMDELQHYDCLVVAILTHGSTNDLIYAKDLPYDAKEVVREFIGSKCPNLANKPKLFFIQACKGPELHKPIFVRTMTDSKPKSAVYTIPANSDVLISYATLEGFKALRSPSWGSPYVKSLCKMLKQYGKERDILEILIRVHHSLAMGNLYEVHEEGIHGPSVHYDITIQPSFFCYLNRFLVFKD